jgi:hypothetical protein
MLVSEMRNITTNPEKLRGCIAIERNCATFNQTGATSPATETQQKNKISLKALADAVIKRNLERNQCATKEKNTRNFLPANDPPQLRKLLPVSVEEIGADAVQNYATSNSIIDGLHPCPLCGGELFNEGTHGGYCCISCQGLPGRGGIARVGEAGNTNKWWLRNENATQRNDQSTTKDATIAKKKVKLSPIALKWLKGHKDDLRLSGWTARELYRRNKSIGIAWVETWNKPGLEITVKDAGVIVFQFQAATGQPIIQTARPIKQRARR